jgi:autotransporter adhesin
VSGNQVVVDYAVALDESAQWGLSINTPEAYSGLFNLSSTPSDSFAHAEGFWTLAGNTNSHAEGERTCAVGENSHSEGFRTLASGFSSHSEGVTTNALGDYSHAEGAATTAVGLGSHSEGSGTQTLGDYSHAEGAATIAGGNYQHVQGQYNLSSTTQSAFIIGNGIDDLNRSNLVLAANNEFNIYGDLNVTGNINGSISATTQFISTTGLTTSAFTITIGTTYWGINYNGNVDVSVPDPTSYDGLKIIIKDEGGYSGSYRIRLTPIAGTIDGNSYVDMNINYMSLTLVARNNNWWII